MGDVAFRPGSMADVLTSPSSGRKDQTNGTQIEDASEDEDPAARPPMEEAEEDERAKRDGEQIEIDEVVQDMETRRR